MKHDPLALYPTIGSTGAIASVACTLCQAGTYQTGSGDEKQSVLLFEVP
jgi:hypothetical protein